MNNQQHLSIIIQISYYGLKYVKRDIIDKYFEMFGGGGTN